MDVISLIVRGDDFGLCHAVNQAICEAFETGILTCASLMGAGPWVAEAAALARDHPEWEIGLQISLHCATAGCRWGPITGPAAAPSLVEPTGTFFSQLPPTAAAEEIARECYAQLERGRSWGVAPAYLEYDGVPHPAVDAALQHLSERYGIPARMTGWGIHPLVLPSGQAKSREETFQDSLSRLTPGVYLWVAHPAQAAPETWGLWPDLETARSREADLTTLCSPEVSSLVSQRGIELISFRQQLEDRLGTEADE